MSLRSKLLGVFAALAVLPLLALGVFEYARSMAAVRRLIADQTAPLADRAARQMGERLQIMNGDLRLLANNEESARLFDAWQRHDSAAFEAARVRARNYFNDVWRVIGNGYAWIAFRDSVGREIERLGGLATMGAEVDASAYRQVSPVELMTAPVQRGNAQSTGSVVAAARLDALVPAALLETHVGHGGYTVIAERSGRAIYDPLSVSAPRGAPALGVARRGVLAHADPAAVLSSLLYTERDTARVATIAAVAGSALVVISSGVIDEFAHSFAQVRLTDLVLALSLTAMLALAFVLVTRRTTRPLEVLTAAATEIGRGNFLPALPPAGDDEVGRLTSAFTTMSGHVDRMMKEIEVSRQMAAVGSFAQQIAHEIRNPLTSIKLNLQSLERDVRDGVVGPDSRRTVEICLEEIQRLDRVVRGVLKLGRARSNGQERASLTGIVERALDIVRPQLVQQRVQLVYTPPPAPSSIIADEEQLVGMFLNLFVNAAEAMPHGGTLRVVVARSDGVGHDTVARITVSDTGPGVAAIARNRIFDPFFTTKNEGSGFGLAVALRDAEQHHGRITLAERSGEIGATFLVELPIARDESV